MNFTKFFRIAFLNNNFIPLLLWIARGGRENIAPGPALLVARKSPAPNNKN